MPFKKGQKKIGGRKVGSKNKATKKTRESVADFIQANEGDLQMWFDSLESGEKKLIHFTKLLEFVMPKQKEVKAEVKNEEPSTFKIGNQIIKF